MRWSAPSSSSRATCQAFEDVYEAYADFLSGEKLDVGRRFHDVSLPFVVDRTEYLRRRCEGKKVLHIGCLDHPEVIAEKFANGTWLHGIISSTSELCVGIDVNRAAYDLVCRKQAIDNIQLLDLSKPLKNKDVDYLRQVPWDLI